MTAQL